MDQKFNFVPVVRVIKKKNEKIPETKAQTHLSKGAADKLTPCKLKPIKRSRPLLPHPPGNFY